MTQIETDWATDSQINGAPAGAQMRHRLHRLHSAPAGAQIWGRLHRFNKRQIDPQIHRFTVHLRVHRFDADCTDSSRDRLTHRFTDSAWTRGCTGLKQIQVHLTDSRVSKKNTDFVKPVTDDRCAENKTDSLNPSNVGNYLQKIGLIFFKPYSKLRFYLPADKPVSNVFLDDKPVFQKKSFGW